MADNTIEFEIVARLDSVEKSLKQIEKQGADTGEKLDKSMGSGLGASISKGLKPTFAVIAAATAAIAGLGFAFSKAIREASEDQASIARLNQSLASAGTFSQEASLSIQAFADRLEETTTIAGSTTLGLVALSRNFTKTNEEATKLTEAAIELSAATGISLEAAVEGLGKSLSGNAGRLAQQVPLIQNFTKEQLKAGAAVQAVLERFGGSEAAKVNTFEGSLLRLSNLFGRLLTGLGNIVVKSPAVTAAFKFIGDRLLSFIDSLDGFFESSGDMFGTFLSISATVGRVLNFAIIGPIELILTLIKRTADALGALGAVFVQVFTGEFKAAADTFSEGVVGAFDFETFEFAGTTAVDNFLKGFKEAVDNAPLNIGDTVKNNVDNGIKEPMAEAITSVNMFELAYQGVANKIAITSAQIAQGMKQVRQAMFQNLVNGVQSAFSSIGSALVKGENVFAAFGKAILGMFGDLALQLGQFYLLLGIGNLFLNPGAAAGQIAAGIGLSVLGGALKALAGGGGGATASSTAATGGGVAGSGFSSGVGEGPTSFAETAPTEPGTQVAVNINGNVLGDKRTLGVAVAEAINEAFGSDGAIIARGALA